MLLTALVQPLAVQPLAAQPPAAAPRSPWSGSAQGSGSLLYGEREQSAFGGRLTMERADSILEFSGSVQLLYGEASRDDGSRAVVKRLWLGSFAADWRPNAVWSPFVLVTAESNLEKRIASRLNTGIGIKITAYRGDLREASLSIALLDERITRLGEGVAVTRLTRWSTRFRIKQAINDRARLSHVTFYKPSAQSLDRYLVLSTTELSVDVVKRLAMTVSVLNNYDSEAVSRGARAYNDGQLLLGLTTRW